MPERKNFLLLAIGMGVMGIIIGAVTVWLGVHLFYDDIATVMGVIIGAVTVWSMVTNLAP